MTTTLGTATARRKHLGTNRCPAGDQRPIDGTCLPASLVQPGNGLGLAGAARRPADHAPVHLSHRERRLPRRLRNARRARGPGRPPVAPDRAAGDPDPGSLIPPAGANLPPQRRPWHDQHDVPPSEPPGRPARCRHGRLPRRRRLFGAELSRGNGGAGELRRLPRRSRTGTSPRTKLAGGRWRHAASAGRDNDATEGDGSGTSNRSQPVVTRLYSSALLNSPRIRQEIANATENAVLRASNGGYRRDCSSTDRRVRGRCRFLRA
jgi:hypothetical protein